MVTGSTTLDAANEVTTLAAATDGTVFLNDADTAANGLTIGEVTVLDGLADEMTVTGISTSDDDVKLTTVGAISIEEAVAIGAGDLFLTTAGNVTQAAAGTITADGLGLMVTGFTTLDAANEVAVVAASTGGTILFNDADANGNDLSVGTVTVLDGLVDEMTLSGITTTNDDTKLVTAGDLSIDQAIDVGTADTFLDVGGSVTQTAIGTITASGLGLMVTGSTTLDAANEVTTLAAATDGTVFLNDADTAANGLTIGEVTVLDGLADEMTVTGISTSDDDVKLTTVGAISIEEAVAIGAGDLFLTTAGNVTQAAVGTITANGLGLMVTGFTTLDAANEVATVAVDNDGTVFVNDADTAANGLTIGEVTVLDGLADEMTVTGISTSGTLINVQTATDLTVEQSVRALGPVGLDQTIQLTAGNDIFLNPGRTGVDVTNTDSSSMTGTVVTDNGQIVISTDGDFAAGTSDNASADAINLDAGNSIDFGNVVSTMGELDQAVVLRTDGGVAHTFVDRPDVLRSNTAFFDFEGRAIPFIASINNQPLTAQGGFLLFLNAFRVNVGFAGEENLRFDIDWRDPVDSANGEGGIDVSEAEANTYSTVGVLNGGNEVTSERYQTFFVDEGGQEYEIAHVYTGGGGSDFAAFSLENVANFIVDFSVSQNDSIQITANFASQTILGTTFTRPIDSNVVTTSDDRNTGLNPLTDDLTNTRAGINPLAGDLDQDLDNDFDEDDDNLDLNFETGGATFIVPTQFPPVELFESGEANRASEREPDQPNDIDVVEPVVTVEEPELPSVSTPIGSRDYYQLRRNVPGSDKLVVLIPEIDEFRGDRLNDTEELNLLFEDLLSEPLQEGAGYQLWLITEDEARGIKVERPIFEFEVTDGKPAADTDELEDDMPDELKLVPVDEEETSLPQLRLDFPADGAAAQLNEIDGTADPEQQDAAAAAASIGLVATGLMSRRSRRKLFSAGARLRRKLNRQ